MPDRTCSIDGCKKPVFVKARGWCAAHYAKWRKYGDPLTRRYGLPPTPCEVDGCDKPGNAGWGWCEKHYRRYQRHGNPLATSRIVGDDIVRFESYVTLGPVPPHAPELGSCWLWKGALNHDGYGTFEVQDLPTASAHRWSYRHHVGPLIDDLELDHLCRVRRCVNAWHLEQVTHLVNLERANALRRAN